MGSLSLIAPESLVLAAAILVLFADVFARRQKRAAAWIGSAAAASAGALALLGGRGAVALFGGQLSIDGVALFSRVATAGLAAVFLLFLAGSETKRSSREFTSLVLFATLGAMLMASARDWVVLLLALETATMPAYVLMGFDRTDDLSLEGALKYFLLSMVATALFLYGMSFVIGMSGTTELAGSRLAPGSVGLIAAVFVCAGLLAKLSAAPFQWWSPDAYAGAPAAAVAFVSAVPKLAGTVVFVRVVQYLAPQAPDLWIVLLVAAVASMLVGNLAAYPQQDVRRLMAYSGVAHAGYLLVGLATGARALGGGTAAGAGSGIAPGFEAAVFYALAYALPSMAVMFVASVEGDRLDSFRGLVYRKPWVAWSVALFLVSLVGIPPLAGFTGKLYLFGAAVGQGLTWLVVFAVAMSAVSAGFYFRIIHAMFFTEPVTAMKDQRPSWPARAAMAMCVIGVVAVGVAASPLLSMLRLGL